MRTSSLKWSKPSIQKSNLCAIHVCSESLRARQAFCRKLSDSSLARSTELNSAKSSNRKPTWLTLRHYFAAIRSHLKTTAPLISPAHSQDQINLKPCLQPKKQPTILLKTNKKIAATFVDLKRKVSCVGTALQPVIL